MNNPSTIDRRDVAHPTNPIGGHDHIEELEDSGKVRPVGPEAARRPAGGNGTSPETAKQSPATATRA